MGTTKLSGPFEEAMRTAAIFFHSFEGLHGDFWGVKTKKTFSRGDA
jgi:hypothetical protein